MSKRILALTESSHLSTGYGVVAREVLGRLQKRGFTVFELASHGPRDWKADWPYESVLPDESERELYESNPLHEFGSLKFERVALEFKPDIVWTYRDKWMSDYVGDSPLRNFFWWANQTPVDAAPQNPEWLDDFARADSLTTYTQWGYDTLKKNAPTLPLFGPCFLGVDHTVFRPVSDKKAHKVSIGLDPESLIVGFVARNQRRKLFPNLLEAFRKFLDRAPEQLTGKTFLYLHTCWPDIGWDIPFLLKTTGTASRVLFTYTCKACHNIFPAFFSDGRAFCRRCGNAAAMMVKPSTGIPDEVMATLYNAMDLYVQLHAAEGFGIPVVEAAACGVPLMVTDYAGTADFIHTLGATPIAVSDYWWECETHRKMAIPDQDDMVYKLIELLRMPSNMRESHGKTAERGIKVLYTWDKVADRWASHFEGLPAPKLPWNAPSRLFQPVSPNHIPPGLDNNSFVAWGFQYVAGRPDLVNSATSNRMLRDLHWGKKLVGRGGKGHAETSEGNVKLRFQDYGREHAMKEFLNMAGRFNHWENERLKG